MHLVIIFMLLFQTLLSASAIDIAELEHKINLFPQSKIYIDTNSNSSDEHIINTPSLFHPYTEETLHQGYTTDSIWLHFRLTNNSNRTIKKVLSFNNAMLDHIVLYTINGNDINIEKTGILNNRTFTENILTFYFDLTLPPQATRDYFLKVKADSCPIFFNLDLMDKKQLYQEEMKHQLILTFFFGAMGALLLYNLFLYFFTKDSAYLYYVLYQVFLLKHHSSLTSMEIYVTDKVLTTWYLEFDAFAAVYYLSFTILFMLLFIRTYLNIKNYPKIDIVLKLFIMTTFILMLITSRTFYPIDLAVLLLMGILVYLIAVGIYLAWKKEENATYFIVGWGVLIIGFIILGVFYYGLTDILFYYPYLFELCVFTEAILFSIALAARLNKTKELENSLARQAVLTKELHHRVKNNMQFIIALYRLKLEEADDIKLTEIENSIKAMSNVHELLYTQEDIEEVDAKLFLQTLIDDLKMTLDTQNIAIELQADARLDIQQAIYCAIILNELITNAVKYAFDERDGKIEVTLEEKDGEFTFTVSDNGKGYDPEAAPKGFGLTLIQQLVERELGGKMEAETTQGSIYRISWYK